MTSQSNQDRAKSHKGIKSEELNSPSIERHHCYQTDIITDQHDLYPSNPTFHSHRNQFVSWRRRRQPESRILPSSGDTEGPPRLRPGVPVISKCSKGKQELRKKYTLYKNII